MEIKINRQYLEEKNRYKSEDEAFEDLNELKSRMTPDIQLKLRIALIKKDVLSLIFLLRIEEFRLYDDRRLSLYFCKLLVNELEQQISRFNVNSANANFSLAKLMWNLDLDKMILQGGEFEQYLLFDPIIKLTEMDQLDKLIVTSDFLALPKKGGNDIVSILMSKINCGIVRELQLPKSVESELDLEYLKYYFYNAKIIFKDNI